MIKLSHLLFDPERLLLWTNDFTHESILFTTLFHVAIFIHFSVIISPNIPRTMFKCMYLLMIHNPVSVTTIDAPLSTGELNVSPASADPESIHMVSASLTAGPFHPQSTRNVHKMEILTNLQLSFLTWIRMKWQNRDEIKNVRLRFCAFKRVSVYVCVCVIEDLCIRE